MNPAEVMILVKARDEASKVLEGIRGKLGGLSSTMKTVAKTGAIALGGLAIAVGGLAVAGVKAASNLQESMSKVNVVFGKSAKEIQVWASKSAAAFGLSKQEALEAAGTFGNLFSALGLGIPEATTLSKSLVELAADLASFNNIGIDEALIKLRAGLVGEAEPLRTLGVNINASTVLAKAMEMGLVDLSGEVTEAGKVQARYALIMEQTKNAQGDFARTSDGLANTQRILSATWKDLQAQLGMLLLPTITKVAQVLANDVLPNVTRFIDVIRGGLAGDVESAAAAFNELPVPLQKLALWLNEHRPQIEELIQNAKDLAVEVRALAQDAFAGWVTIVTELQPKLTELGKWLIDHQPILIGVAVAIGAVLILLAPWPVALVLIIAAVGILVTKLEEWRAKNEDLDKTLDDLAAALDLFGAATVRVTKFVEDHEAAQILLMGVLRQVAAPMLQGWFFLGLLASAFDKATDVAYWFKDALYSVRDAAFAARDAIQSAIDKLKIWERIPGIGAAGDLWKKIPGFASGGTMPYSGMAMVGEEGREIVAMPGGARIYNNRDTERMLGGPSTNNITISVHVQGDATDATVERMKQAFQDALVRATTMSGLGGGFTPVGAYNQ